MRFDVMTTDGFARRGRLTLAHGTVETPAFMPVGTLGAVKTIAPEELLAMGAEIILGNTYHLYLRPGLDVLKPFSGLHRFMGWERPILTDSGGFQVFSLGKLKKVSDASVLFQSHLNGDTLSFTPELSAQIQQAIGSDIAMVFDECVALPNSRETIQTSVQRSYLWAKRFLAHPRQNGQAIFGISQGGCELDLRAESLEMTLSLNPDGIAVGGLSVGEPFNEMVRVLDSLAPKLPSKLPHYLMGVGTPRDILEAVHRGIDMFDCVLPTRNARNGGFFTNVGLLNIRNAVFKTDPNPIDEHCLCPACKKFSRAYLRHLFNVKEILGLRLATLHNLYYYLRFMREIRESLEKGEFQSFYQNRIQGLETAYPGRREV